MPLTVNLPEVERLRALAALQVMDSAEEPVFDALAAAASALCGTPIALISLVDDRRQWFKANVGLPGVSETARELAFCAHAIQGEALFEVPDATQDSRFVDNPLVTGQPEIRFYAGAPLSLPGGARVGTLCVIDRTPRQLDERQREVLVQLAQVVTEVLTSRAMRLDLERQRAAQRQLELRFNALTDVAPIGVFATDVAGQCTFVNAAWQQLHGLGAAQAAGEAWLQLPPPEERDTLAQAWREAVQRQAPYEGRFRIQRADGLRQVQVSATPLRGDDGQFQGHVGTVVDETERSLAVDALLDVIRAQFVMCITDAEGRILEVNEAFTRLCGHVAPALLGTELVALDAGQHPPALFEEIRASMAAGRSWRGELGLRHRQGQLHWVDTTMAPLRGLDGRIARTLSIGIDITDRKAQADALVRTQLLLQRTSQVAHVGGWELDLGAEGPVWTDETCRIHGVPPGYQPSLDEAIGFYAPEAQPVITEAVAQAMQTGGGWDLELPLVRRDGQRIWVHAVGQVQMQDGQAVRLYGAFQDVTERRQQAQALREAYERASLATTSGGIGVWEFDFVTEVPIWDAQMYRLYDVPRDGTPLRPEVWNERLHPADRAATEAALARAVRDRTPFDAEFRVVWRDGTVRHLRSSAHLLREGEEGGSRWLGVNWDVTELREANVKLAEQHELLHVTLQSIGDAVITTDAQARVTWLNPAAERMTGWTSGDAMGVDIGQVFYILNADTRLAAECPVQHCLREGRPVGLATDTLLIGRTGVEFGIEDSAAPIRDAGGRVLGAVLVFHDVTEQRRLSGEMSYRATHDPLTGLFNRDEMDGRLRALLQQAHHDGSQHALLYIDLDQFKVVNDSCGHSAGDQLLQRVASLMGEAVRSRDLLARLGGDEFGVLLEHCTTEQGMRVAQKICEAMEQFRFVHGEQRFRVGASIGLVPVDRRFATSAQVMQAADAACYAAKEGGRNRVHEWVEADTQLQHRQAEMQWATRLERALDDEAFELFVQRIVPLKVLDAPLHAELLLRLPNPAGGYFSPGVFFPAAERYHLASRIDRWVLRRVIDQLQNWPAHLSVGLLSVNLSGQSVGDRSFHQHALALLQEAGPALCNHLCLEITETAAITSMADASQFVRAVRALGVRVALDDFGAGASSFGYLKRLQVDYLKIDGQFVKDVLDDPLDAAAVRSFVEVARVVGVETVAEFVDRAEVLDWLNQLGVDHAQGYHLHQPEPLADLLRALR